MSGDLQLVKGDEVLVTGIDQIIQHFRL